MGSFGEKHVDLGRSALFGVDLWGITHCDHLAQLLGILLELGLPSQIDARSMNFEFRRLKLLHSLSTRSSPYFQTSRAVAASSSCSRTILAVMSLY